MRVKFKSHVELCMKIRIVKINNTKTNILKITAMDNDNCYVECVDVQEAEDLYNMAYKEGYINISERNYEWR